ncbi:MAG: hypothetical protein QXH20_02805 [Candidatus Bathyarchaeia archaeon]
MTKNKNFQGNFGTNYCFYKGKCVNKKVTCATKYKPHCTVDTTCTFRGDNYVRLKKRLEVLRKWMRN